MTSSPDASWIFGDGPGPSGWAGIEGIAPDVFARYGDMRAELVRLVPPRVVEMCRARMAALLGIEPADVGSDSDWRRELARWPVSPHFSDAERAALDVAEQFAIDVTGIEQGQIDRLLGCFTPEETLGLISALWFEEAMLRLGAVLGIPVPDLAPGQR